MGFLFARLQPNWTGAPVAFIERKLYIFWQTATSGSLNTTRWVRQCFILADSLYWHSLVATWWQAILLNTTLYTKYTKICVWKLLKVRNGQWTGSWLISDQHSSHGNVFFSLYFHNTGNNMTDASGWQTLQLINTAEYVTDKHFQREIGSVVTESWFIVHRRRLVEKLCLLSLSLLRRWDRRRRLSLFLLTRLHSLCPWMTAYKNVEIQSGGDTTALKSSPWCLFHYLEDFCQQDSWRGGCGCRQNGVVPLHISLWSTISFRGCIFVVFTEYIWGFGINVWFRTCLISSLW